MRAPIVAALLAFVLVLAPHGRAAASTENAPGASTVSASPEAPRYALRASGIPDALLLSQCGGEAALQRLWQRHELTALAGRLREVLASQGRYDATIRLVLAAGAGSQPGAATLSLVTSAPPPTLAAAAATALVAASDSAAAAPTPSPVPAPASAAAAVTSPTSPPSGVRRSVAIVTGAGGSPIGLPDPAGSFARGARGGSDPASIAAGIDAIRDDEVAAGRYASAVAIDSVVASGPEVLVYLRVAEGPAVTLESLELAGATSTRPSTAATISGLKPGRTLSPALLAEGRERLIASNLFVTVGEPRVAPGTEPARARVVIPVEEASASSFQGALGMGSGGGLTGLLDIALGNIGGSGRSAGARWAGLGNGNSNYALRYREPALFGRPIDATFQLDAQVAESLYTQTRWVLGFGVRPSARAQGALALARTGSVYSGVGRGSSSTWSTLGRFEWQGLAPRMNPTRGWGAAVELEAGKRSEAYPGIPELTRGLLREGVTLQSAVPLGGPRALYARVRAEQVSLGEGAFPAEELLYLGGSNGLRGHRDRAYAGNRVLAMSVEQRWITSPSGGRCYVFFDAARHELGAPVEAGVVTAPGGSSSLARTVLSDGWEMGYGAGLLTRMASGLIGLELGLRPAAALREATVHVRYTSVW